MVCFKKSIKLNFIQMLVWDAIGTIFEKEIWCGASWYDWISLILRKKSPKIKIKNEKRNITINLKFLSFFLMTWSTFKKCFKLNFIQMLGWDTISQKGIWCGTSWYVWVSLMGELWWIQGIQGKDVECDLLDFFHLMCDSDFLFFIRRCMARFKRTEISSTKKKEKNFKKCHITFAVRCKVRYFLFI